MLSEVSRKWETVGMCVPEKDHNTKVLYPQCGFLYSFREWMRGFYNLMKIRPSSLFMSRLSPVSFVLLMTWSLNQDLVEGILVCMWLWCSMLKLCMMCSFECQPKKHKAFLMGPVQKTECILELTMSSAISLHRQTKVWMSWWKFFVWCGEFHVREPVIPTICCNSWILTTTDTSASQRDKAGLSVTSTGNITSHSRTANYSLLTNKVTGEWRKLHNEELSDLYALPNIVRVVKLRRMRWVGHVARMEKGRGAHRVLVGKPVRKRLLGRQRRRWEDNIKMDLKEVGGGCGDWMELAQDRDR